MRQTLLSVLLSAALLLTVMPAHAEAPPLLTAGAEYGPAGSRVPPPALVTALLPRVDRASAELFSECLSQEGIPPRKRHLQFSAAKLPSPRKGRVLYFVRPALDASCRAFYGAHIFQHWLVEHDVAKGPASLQMVFDSAADGFDVLPAVSRGRYHVVTTGCDATACTLTEWVDAGRGYARHRCWELRTAEDGREVREPQVCAAP